jgi:hypothetical protein
VVLVDLGDLAAHAAGDLPQLTLLIDRLLVDSGNPKVENSAFHGETPRFDVPAKSPPEAIDFVDAAFFNTPALTTLLPSVAEMQREFTKA